MKAQWLDEPDKNVCLCCGQAVVRQGPGKPMTPERALRAWGIFLALGLTREDLLGKYREVIDYQSPGFAEWLQAQ
jgi:hypothetical protein